MRIYIAGPYSAYGCSVHNAVRVSHQNVKRAIKKFHELKAMGHIPFVPHLSHYLHQESPEDYSVWWLDYDFTFLDHWAEAIYMMRGWSDSPGSREELKRAKDLGLKIQYEDDYL